MTIALEDWKKRFQGLAIPTMSRPPLELEEEDDPPSFKHPERYGDAPDEDSVNDDDDVEIGDECKAETEVESDKMLERAMQNGRPVD
jgi:hypothetical protein